MKLLLNENLSEMPHIVTVDERLYRTQRSINPMI